MGVQSLWGFASICIGVLSTSLALTILSPQNLTQALKVNSQEPLTTMTINDQHRLPSHMQPVPGSVNIPIAKFPMTVGPAESGIPELAERVIDQFNEGLANCDSASLSSLFAADGFWRDHLVLSWAFRTVNGRQGVRNYLHSSFTAEKGPILKSIALDTTSPDRLPQSGFLDGQEVPCLIFSFTLDSTVGSGKGVARLIQVSPGTWSIFTLYTVLQQLHGHKENIFERRPQGVQHGGVPGRTNWAERRKAEEEYEDGSNPDVLILGEICLVKSPRHLQL